MVSFNYKGHQFGGLRTDGFMCLPHSGVTDHLVSAQKLAGMRLAGVEQADGYGSTCEEERTQPVTVSVHISLYTCDNVLLLNCPLNLYSDCSVDMDRRALMHKGLFQVICRQVQTSRLSQCQCCVGTQRGPRKRILWQIPEPQSYIAHTDGC